MGLKTGRLLPRQAVCRCTLNTPASAAQQANDYSRNAALQHQMWQHQSQMFAQAPQPPVDIALPRLLRQTVPELGPMPAPGAAPVFGKAFHLLHSQEGVVQWGRALSFKVHVCMAGPMDKETAIKVVRQARLQAEAAVATAARYAAAAGLIYQAPAGFRVEAELQRVSEP